MNRDELIKQLLATVKSGAPHWVDLPLNIHGPKAADLIASLEASLDRKEAECRHLIELVGMLTDKLEKSYANLDKLDPEGTLRSYDN